MHYTFSRSISHAKSRYPTDDITKRLPVDWGIDLVLQMLNVQSYTASYAISYSYRWRNLIAFLLHYILLRTFIGIVFAFTLNWFDIRATCYCHDVWPVFVKENSIRCHPISTQCNDAAPNCHLCAGVSPHKGNVASAQLSLETVAIRGDHFTLISTQIPSSGLISAIFFEKSLKSLSSWRCLSVSSPIVFERVLESPQ